MKRTLVLLFCLSVFVSCKQDAKKTAPTTKAQNEVAIALKGEFVYFADAAVLQTESDVYGVILNEKMHELNDQAKAFKKKSTDMVPVEIIGVLKPKPEGKEGWPFQVEITEIIKVSPPLAQDENTITIKNINN